MNEFRDLQEPRPFSDAQQQAIDDLKLQFKQNSEINFQTDNYFLTKFLRYRDWNVDGAYKSIVNYYQLKVKHKVIIIKFDLQLHLKIVKNYVFYLIH